MGAAEVVVHEVQGDCGGQVLQLPWERIGQARETAHAHADREVLPLHVGRADVRRVGRAADLLDRDELDGGRAVLGALGLGLRLELLHDHRVVLVRAERVSGGAQVHLVPVRGELHTAGQPAAQVAQDRVGVLCGALADVRGWMNYYGKFYRTEMDG